MLMRTDSFRDMDRLTGICLALRPVAIDAYRAGDTYGLEFDLLGVSQDSVDLTVEPQCVGRARHRDAR